MPLVAVVHQKLRGFAGPDTGSAAEGSLQPGVYPVLEFRQGYPNPKTDYARIAIPRFAGGDTWICSRWKDEGYATVRDGGQSAPTFDQDPLAVAEDAITRLLPTFTPYHYSLKEAFYPWPLPGCSVPVLPPGRAPTNNCCTFVEALVVKAWADARPGFAWNRARHDQMMVNTSDLFSPVTAVADAKMALPVPQPDTPPHPWTVMQVWSEGFGHGHTLIVVDHHPGTGKVLTLESNTAGMHLDGVGWRGIGPLRDNPTPGQWWNRASVPTWAALCTTYPNRRQAWLRVKGRKLSGLP